MSRLAAATTSGVLLGIVGLHVAWGRGSSFPFATSSALSETVVGADVVPSPAACYAVAGLLTTAAGLTAGLPARGSTVRRVGVLGVAAVLGARAALGFSGRTGLVSPGSVGERFRRSDRRIYSPLCLALATGAVMSLRG